MQGFQGRRSITPREWDHHNSHDPYDKETANVTLQYPRHSSINLDENDSILEVLPQKKGRNQKDTQTMPKKKEKRNSKTRNRRGTLDVPAEGRLANATP